MTVIKISSLKSVTYYLLTPKDKYGLEYNISYVFPYESIAIKYDNCKLTLNSKPPYLKNQLLIGTLDLQIEEIITNLDGSVRDPKLKFVKGTFEVQVN